jgi:type I protein arginine methyltransferase
MDTSGMAVDPPVAAAGPGREPGGGQEAQLMSRATAATYYEDSYAHYGIHEEMLKDTVRTRTYQRAICDNAFLFRDKVVLDVGCGTGILSLFAVKAGARHVYAVDASDIADLATTIVQLNGFSDRITVIKRKVEEVELPVDKVDIIISEWMGYFLLYESMLNTVLYARDKWLVPGGLIFPDSCGLYVCAIEDAQWRADKLDYWSDVYGFDFSPVRQLALEEPLVDVVSPDQVVTPSVCIKRLDITTMRAEDACIDERFVLKANRADFVHALVVYFDAHFSACHKKLSFSTGPRDKETHWKQAVLYLPDDSVPLCAGEELHCRLTCAPNASNPRDLDISLEYSVDGKRCSLAERKQSYRMR